MVADALNCAKTPSPSGDRGAFLLGLAARLQQMYRMMASAGVINPAPAGGTSGRHVGETCAWVSFKPKLAFNVIAHVSDWEHAETVSPSLSKWTVGGFALRVECTGAG